ncbi:MAG TPA: hypothetical protein VHL58_12370 [Thermoanaerobaculia bacterium]|nr:hypothetical protein [Thermoanaerobaculia bacterium]
MTTRLKITSRSAGAIRHTGGAVRSIGPDVIVKTLGAEEVVSTKNVHGAPISLHALRRELESRVRSTGGRPALEGATKIQKIPLKPEDWSRLEELAARLTREGVSATAGQVASVIVHSQLELLAASAATRHVPVSGGPLRRTTGSR